MTVSVSHWIEGMCIILERDVTPWTEIFNETKTLQLLLATLYVASGAVQASMNLVFITLPLYVLAIALRPLRLAPWVLWEIP